MSWRKGSTECPGCTTRQEIITDLREQLALAHKTLLAVTDKAAYRMLHGGRVPNERPGDAPLPPLPNPAHVPFQPAAGMSFDEIERSFTLDQEVEAQRIADESRKLDDAMAELMKRPGM